MEISEKFLRMPYHRVGAGSEAVDLYYEVKGALG